MIFENTNEPIISKQGFDLVQEIRNNRRRKQKTNQINPFSGIVYCADCGKLMYICRHSKEGKSTEHFKCGSYSYDSRVCSAHCIRTVVLEQVVLSEMNSILDTVTRNEEAFVKTTIDSRNSEYMSEVKNAKKLLTKSEKRITKLNGLFTRLYENNVSGKISDVRGAKARKLTHTANIQPSQQSPDFWTDSTVGQISISERNRVQFAYPKYCASQGRPLRGESSETLRCPMTGAAILYAQRKSADVCIVHALDFVIAAPYLVDSSL